MSASHDDLVSQFANVTGIDPERAQFYLESSAWQLDVALASFYDNDGDPSEAGLDAAVPINVDPPSAGKAGDQSRPAATSRFGTVSHKKESSSDSDEEGQAYYAGGSETSGQQIVGPRKKRGLNSGKLVEDMFKAAKDHGAEVVEPSAPAAQGRPSAFGGAGYRLGETEETSAVIPGTASNSGPRQVDMVLKLWKDGFCVEDGPLRRYDEPENREFLESIKNGEVPRELIRLARGGEVNLNMEDHRTDDYVPPKQSLKAFSGEGHVLGSPAPRITGQPSPVIRSTINSGNQGQRSSISVDSSQPITNLQIRLADGTRLVAKFNHSHTIADVRTHITSGHPQYVGVNFVLMTTFPNKELSDESQTLEDAKLLNAVLVQRVK